MSYAEIKRNVVGINSLSTKLHKNSKMHAHYGKHDHTVIVETYHIDLNQIVTAPQ